jgi:phenylalanyl-tRNA synthetase beta chain
MKVTYNWLKDFVDIKISAEVLADRLTMAGLEVVFLEKKGNDWVLELEITPNRADCLSVIGIAREVAAITNSKFKIQNLISQFKIKKGKDLEIKIEDKRDCPLYVARLISSVKVRNSPDWLKTRLENVGIRAVNNIVDITNYVLIETGQPLHAFDYDRLEEHRIIVRRAKDGERIINIDGIERELNSDCLVIADSHKPVAIAGIMGSKDTEITENTKNVLLESAEFNPLVIRRARRYLGLMTESAYRFERGVDKYSVIFASKRAEDLIKKIAEGNLRIFKIEGEFKERQRIVSLNIKDVERNLGEYVCQSKIKKIFKSLSFRIKEEKDKLKVYIPSFRKDIKEEIDLIEEIARIFGYDNIPLTLPYIKVSTPKTPIQDLIKGIIKSSLLKMGLNEVITYSFIDPDYLREKEEAIGIINPLSQDLSYLRPNLLFSLLKVLEHNMNRDADSVAIFELAKIYSYKQNLPKEEDVLGILVWGNFYSDWLRNQRFNFSLFDLKGIIETILRDLGIENFQFKKSQIPYLVEGVIFGLKDKE